MGGREFNPSQATSFLFSSTKVITFKPSNIFELIWYSEWPLDSSFLSSLLGFDLILRFSVTFVGGGGFPEEPSTGGVFCGSNPPFCTCRPNAQGTDCICKGPSC